MHFSAVVLLSLVAVAFASPVAMPDRLDDLVSRSPQIGAEAASMSDANGNVVSFDSSNVYKAASAAGL